MEKFVSLHDEKKNQAAQFSLKTISRFQNLAALSKRLKKLTSQNLNIFLKKLEKESLLKFQLSNSL